MSVTSQSHRVLAENVCDIAVSQSTHRELVKSIGIDVALINITFPTYPHEIYGCTKDDIILVVGLVVCRLYLKHNKF